MFTKIVWKWEVFVNTYIVDRQNVLVSSLKLLHGYMALEPKNTSQKPKADCQVDEAAHILHSGYHHPHWCGQDSLLHREDRS